MRGSKVITTWVRCTTSIQDCLADSPLHRREGREARDAQEIQVA
jgi:hypothetical protein